MLSSLTALFADRGVSIESLTAHSGGGAAAPNGTAILTFTASDAKKGHLARLLGRLASVQELTEYRYDNAGHARKSALARVTLSADALIERLPPGILCDIVSATEDQTLALLLGPPPTLDALLAELAGEDVIQEMDSTVIVV